MLQDIYYIIKPGIIQQPVLVGEGTVIVLEVDIAGKKIDNPLFQLIEKFVTDSPFCLLVHLYNTLTQEQAMDIIGFTFFINYHKPNGIPLIMVKGENRAMVTAG